jgi:single-stranded-DNA-specific exonuclease
LIKGGGHAMAGGFTIDMSRITEFRAFMEDHIRHQAASVQVNINTVIEGVLSIRGIRADLIKMILNNIGPFGQEHAEPLFMLSNVRIHTADVMGASHIRAMVSDWEGGTRIKAVAFKAVGTPLGDAILKQGRQPFHMIGHLKLDTWNGRESPEFHIRDAAFAMPEQQVSPATSLRA